MGASAFRIIVKADGEIKEEVKNLECTLNPLRLGRVIVSHYVEDTSAGKLVYRLRQSSDGDELVAYEGAPLGIRRVEEVYGEIKILPVTEAEAAVA